MGLKNLFENDTVCVASLCVSLLPYIFIYLFLQTKLKIGLLIKATVAAVC